MLPSLADIVAPHLPYLRRFGRALTGTQQQGDAYVAALLEALVAERSLLDRKLEPRVATYNSFLRVWNTVPLNHETEFRDSSSGAAADRRIATLTPEPRQAFLLSSLEDFTTSDVAKIMGKSEEQIHGLIDTASREIAEQMAARVLIIEDEPLIAMDIESLVSDLGHKVVGIAPTRGQAVTLAERESPTLVLADIQLADGSSGIDAVNDILKGLNVPVVFITAYPERLLTGEKPEPAFLVTKPFRPEMVKAVISQALFFDMTAGGKSGRVAAA